MKPAAKALAKGPVAPARLRCAIYTRKSTEEGLEQEFNTLDAQREACEAYVQSQKHLGWICSPERYDDGGFTGANLERPAMQRLMADIDASKVDVVVVYKVDRLSRSLLDFARIIEMFEKRKVCFVSITQQFNTALSLGRLVLNILLSFAQFEREMIAERTRDKMAAARRKGKWVGGRSSLGYDVAPGGGKLVVNEAEAAQVREAFRLYLAERSLVRVIETLNSRGWRTKSGAAWDKSTLHRLLLNVVYIGKVDYRDEIYAGEHAAIVDPEVFAQAGELLGSGRRDVQRTGNKHGFLLRGLVHCTACGSMMTSSTGTARGRTYRYYTCTQAKRRGTSACPVRTVSAVELEAFVVSRIRDLGRDPALLQDTMQAVIADRERDKPALEREQRTLQVELPGCRTEARKLVAALGEGGDTPSLTSRLAELDTRVGQIEERLAALAQALEAIDRAHIEPDDVAKALAMFDPVWDALVPREQASLMQLLVERVDYDGQGGEVSLAFRPAGIASLAADAAARAA